MLQIFTYSTGLALTGRSAACVPETATSPAAEPRRRLFTIFIRTSKLLFMGGFRLRRVRCRPMDGRSPSVPSSVQTPDQKPLPDPGPKLGDLGMPPPSHRHLTRRSEADNK